MKNVQVFVDVDLTLVDHLGNLVPGAAEALARLKARDCHLFLWSTGGMEYARKVALRHNLQHLFEGYAPKPDIIIDDSPSSVLKPFVFNPNDEPNWAAIADRILSKHVDPV